MVQSAKTSGKELSWAGDFVEKSFRFPHIFACKTEKVYFVRFIGHEKNTEGVIQKRSISFQTEGEDE